MQLRKGFNLIITLIVIYFIPAQGFMFNDLDVQDGYLAFAEKMPAPNGGLEAIYANIEYPGAAKSAGIQGKVYALVFVNESGGVDDVKIIKGIGAGCDEATIAAIKKCSFSPGQHEGKSVKVKLSLAIQFKLV